MIGWTLCSGIGAPEMAAPWVDWRLASEIEPFPRAVLQERFGYAPHEDHNQGDPILWGDMETLDLDTVQARGVPLPDLLVAGTPCQSFSVAGLRKGLSDSRGNLTLKFVEICHAIVAARPDGKLKVLWENVPGVLSDNGNAFGAFLGGLVGAMDALPCPADGRWPGEGMVSGPRARAAWAVLDAQWFGVAQRRRRVFVVVDFGGACDPAAVLLEPDSVRGNPPSRGEAGERVAADARSGSAGSHWDGTEVHPSLNQSHNTGGIGASNQEVFSQRGAGLVPSPVVSAPNISPALKARDAKGPSSDGDGDGDGAPLIAHALRGEGFDASEGGTGRATPPVPIAFHPTQDPISSTDGLVHALGTGSSLGQCSAAVAFDLRGREDGAQIESVGETVSLRAADGGSSRSYIANTWAVRRLTPTECARLQGFPDDHTAITYRGKPAADGPQYKAYGNSMAVPCVRWILERMK